MSLVDGKFFEVAEGILGIPPKDQKIEMERRKSMSRKSSLLSDKSDLFNLPMEEWMIERLKYHVTPLTNYEPLILTPIHYVDFHFDPCHIRKATTERHRPETYRQGLTYL